MANMSGLLQKSSVGASIFTKNTVLNVKEVSEMTKETSSKGEKLSFNDEKTFSGENKQIFVEKMRVRKRM